MECNKEEARRAKEIAESKMQNKDFLGAKKIVLKAQQLFPDLENISQMLTVCEVHCCAGAMINGVIDWYGILQVEQFADELSIKKQYRRLALQLHPDKNKFAGAEAAFKLIGEAHMTLSDRGKRSVYDSKRRLNSSNFLPRQPSHPPSRSYYAKTQPGVPGNCASNTNQQSSTSNSQSFWAMCPRCCQRYEYPRFLINRLLRCHRCNSDFVANELHAQAVPIPGTNSTQPLNHTKKSKEEVPGQQSHTGNSSNAGFQGNVAGGPTVQKSRSSSGINVTRGSVGSSSKEKLDGTAGSKLHFEKVNHERKRRDSKVKPSAVNAKRKSGWTESSDSVSSSDSVEKETVGQAEAAEQSAGTRRSSRPKQKVAYNEALKDDDLVTAKRSRKGGSSFHAAHSKANSPDVSGFRNNEDAKCTVDSSSNGSPGPASFSYPDPEFGNFEGERVESKFGAGQVWAVYDDLDAMPRYYVRIREVCAGEFRLHFNWLEHNAINNTETAWTKAELPVASGNYRLGKSESTRTLQMFSHLMCWEKGGTRRITYNIYPRKGEVWALYKGWDFKWSSDADSHRLYEYEVVEVLFDFADNCDILVVHHLVKIEGFLSLFMPAIDKGIYRIPSTEVLRFSHKVPSYRLTGAEREGTLKGCLELDVASLPDDFADAFPSISLDNAALKSGNFDDTFINPCRSAEEEGVATSSKNGDPKEKIHVNKTAGHRVHSADAVNEVAPNSDAAGAGRLNSPSLGSPLLDTNDYPVGEFHDFEEDKSVDKIKRGQIWALYSDVDQFPKYYAKIRSVKESTVYASWVELVPRRMDEKMWSKKGLPCGCGTFKVQRKVNSFDTTDILSHMVHAMPGERDQYDIFPRSGEVWALYKGWSIEWTLSDLEKCDYDVVEVRECSRYLITVVILTKVDGYSTVFMPERKGEVQTLEIPADGNLRFSHQIPAFRLTDQESSELQGYWELHSLSVPHKFL